MMGEDARDPALFDAIAEAWNKINQEIIDNNLSSSLIHRHRVCIDVDGKSFNGSLGGSASNSP
jgi:hypothetical protein